MSLTSKILGRHFHCDKWNFTRHIFNHCWNSNGVIFHSVSNNKANIWNKYKNKLFDTINCNDFKENLKPLYYNQYRYYSKSVAQSKGNLEDEINKIMNEYNTLDPVKNSKRLKIIKPMVELIQSINNVMQDMKSLDDLKSDKSEDKEMKALLDSEMKTYSEQIHQLEEELVHALLKSQDQFEDCSEIVIEISAGAGGQEAMLFAQEIYEMYMGYAAYKNWEIESQQSAKTDIGGVRQAILHINGKDCFSFMKYEGGVHRVQRVPKTERSGRIHTSTASVAILPQPKDIQVNIEDKDLKIETKKSSGPGGQSVNTSDSAVRIVHIPTGLVVESQEERSQIKNKLNAMKKLKILIYEAEFEKQESESKIKRKIQIGRKNRNEKIRTYNYPQDRVTDHRIHKNIFNITGFMNGTEELDELINDVRESDYEYRITQLFDRC